MPFARFRMIGLPFSAMVPRSHRVRCLPLYASAQLGCHEHREGPIAKAIEEQTAKLPSGSDDS